MQWLNEPASWQRTGDVVTVNVDSGTDFWRETGYGYIRDSGHVYGELLSGDLDVSVRVRGTFAAQYDQAGVMLRVDDRVWLKTGLEFFEGRSRLSTVLTLSRSSWTVTDLPSGTDEVTLRVSRRGDAVEVRYITDDGPAELAALVFLPPGREVLAGVMCAAPEGPGFGVTFSELRIIDREWSTPGEEERTDWADEEADTSDPRWDSAAASAQDTGWAAQETAPWEGETGSADPPEWADGTIGWADEPAASEPGLSGRDAAADWERLASSAQAASAYAADAGDALPWAAAPLIDRWPGPPLASREPASTEPAGTGPDGTERASRGPAGTGPAGMALTNIAADDTALDDTAPGNTPLDSTASASTGLGNTALGNTALGNTGLASPAPAGAALARAEGGGKAAGPQPLGKSTAAATLSANGQAGSERAGGERAAADPGPPADDRTDPELPVVTGSPPALARNAGGKLPPPDLGAPPDPADEWISLLTADD